MQEEPGPHGKFEANLGYIGRACLKIKKKPQGWIM
jgi:hypothetical protein